jgi:predicted ATPase
MGVGTSGTEVQVRLLGGFAVWSDGRPADDRWRLRKAKTMVKLLALAPNHRMHRDALIDVLWPDQGVSAATNNLSQAMHAARRALGGAHVVMRDDVVGLDSATVDVDVFEDAAAKARASGDIEELRAAVSHWTGPLLPEDAYEEWATPHRDRLTEVHVALVTHLGTVLVDADRAAEAVTLLEALASERPLDEVLHRALVGALAATGRRFEAIAAYEQLRDALDAEFAAEPQAETKAVYRQLLGTTAPTMDAPHNLPLSVTSFVGRQRQLAELASTLDRARLVTLTGPGGAGKTRLSIELARRRLTTGDHPDGAWFVELAAIQDDELVPSAVASVLRTSLSAARSPIAALTAQLAGKQLLLVLDNCEHLLNACADLVSELLAQVPDLVVLTTSREPLGLPGEVTWRVPSLELPPPDGDIVVEQLTRLEAVQLFSERAREVALGFRVDDSNAVAVARICFRLDGIPLALELAAARMSHLSAPQVAERLGDSLALLARHGRGRLDRQQTLAATLDWSHELLDDGERVVFRRLAVFAGGFDLDAAEQVCAVGDVVDVLARLVDKSLVHADTSGEQARYRLLEVVRQYAEVRAASAGELTDCRHRHLQWYAEKADEHDPDRGDPVVHEPSAWFDVEQDNLRAALAASLEQEPSAALVLATSTWRFWMTRGQLAEGTRWLTLALNGCDEVSLLRARALFARSVLMVRQGRSEPLLEMADEIAVVYRSIGDPAGLAQGTHGRSMLMFMAGDWNGAYPLVDETILLARDFPAVAASAHHFAACIALGHGDYDEADECLHRAAAALDKVPNSEPPFFVGMTIGWVVDDRGAFPIPYGEETVLLGKRFGAEQARGYVTSALALSARVQGRVDDAVAMLDDATARFRAIDDAYGTAFALCQRGHTLRWRGEPDAALPYFRESEQLRRGLRDLRALALASSGRAIVDGQLGRAEAARQRAAEATTMMDRSGDGAGLALTITNAALVERELGDSNAAAALLERALSEQTVPGGHRSVGWQELMLALLRLEQGDEAAATELAGRAYDIFADFGESRGLAALQRACKELRLRLPTSQQF